MKPEHPGRPRLSVMEVGSLWLPVIVWAAFIFYFSSLPYLRFVQPWWDYPLRKAGHMMIFGILARLIARALTGSTFWPWKKIFAWSLLLALLYAATDEYHQSFTPGRGATVQDVVIDGTGAWIALGMIP
ncbi:MAG: VanZ family protein [Elusimicrobiota bacterium]